MAGTTPYIVMAFASPEDDLDFMVEEEDQLSRKLTSLKAQRQDFDFYPIRRATRKDILDSFADLQNQKPCFFHYSGHSNGIVLKLQDGETTPAFELSQILKNDNIKIVFLNGCSTQGLVKEIFENTKVKAVIATRSPVADYRAKDISLEFYKHFVINRLPLQDAFDNLLSTTKYTQTCINIKGFDTKRELGWDTAAKLDDAGEFSWGLFYSDSDIRTYRFTDLVGSSMEDLTALRSKRDKAKEILDNLQTEFSQMKPGDPGYNIVKGNVDGAKKDFEKHVIDIKSIEKEQQDIIKNLSEQDKQRDLEYALKRLNYEKQRNNYLLKSKCFGGFAISGDQYSFHDLLCYNFRWENDLGRNYTITFLIDAGQRGFEGFWKKLAFDVGLEIPEQAKPADDLSLQKNAEELQALQQSIVKKLLDEYYLERGEGTGNERPTKRDVLIKIKIGAVAIPDWINMITDFWKHVGQYLQSNPPRNAGVDYSKWHKMVIFLLDEDTSDEKQKLLNEKFDQISSTLPSVFSTLPPIDNLTKDELCKWITDYRLHTVGFSETDAATWYKDSEEGKLIKLVYLLKDKTRYNNIEIFQILNYEPIKQ